MRHNGRAPLLASQMNPANLSLRENEPHLAVCPDCDTWHRLTRSMIRPHRAPDATPDRSTRRYLGDKPAGGRRCPGSAQRITIDITTEQWGQALLAADSTATGRRSARQHYKPLPAPAKAITQMSPDSQSPAEALAAYRRHLKTCRASSTSGRCGGTHRCPAGAQLAKLYEQVLAVAGERREAARDARLVARTLTASQWRKHQADTKGGREALAKRSGTRVEEENNACRFHPADTVSELRGLSLPLDTLRPEQPAR